MYLTEIEFWPSGSSTTIGHNRKVTHITRINDTFKQKHNIQNNNKGHHYSKYRENTNNYNKYNNKRKVNMPFNKPAVMYA
jgi:hypothetical protein